MSRSARGRASAAASPRATRSVCKTEIVGVQSAEAPAYALSFAAGHVVRTNSADTFADGMATRVPDEEALAVIARGAARIALVGDEEIADAIRAYWTDTHNLAEGAGAAALAAAMKETIAPRGAQGRAGALRAATSTSIFSAIGCDCAPTPPRPEP